MVDGKQDLKPDKKGNCLYLSHGIVPYATVAIGGSLVTKRWMFSLLPGIILGEVGQAIN